MTNKKIVVVISGLLLLVVVVLVVLANSPLLETLTGSGDFSLSRMGFFGLPEEYWEVTIQQTIGRDQLETFGGPERLAEILTMQIGENLSREHAEQMEFGVKLGEKVEEGVIITTVLSGRDPAIIGTVMFDDLGELYNLLAGPIDLKMRGAVKVGTPLHLNLLMNSSTGYGWYTLSKSEVASKKGERTRSKWEVYPGTPEVQNYEYVFNTSGDVELTLNYTRYWEKPDAWQSSVILITQNEFVPAFDLIPAAPNFGDIPPNPVVEYESEYKWDDGISHPETYNWTTTDNDIGRALNLIVGDQGGCGSCWAFATTGVTEAAYQVQKGSGSFNLSEQYLVACNRSGVRCDGWSAFWAIEHYINRDAEMSNPPGAVLESAMPYDETNFTCRTIQDHPILIEHRWQAMPDFFKGYQLSDVFHLKLAMRRYGPLAVSVCASDEFKQYSGGVYDVDDCQITNHAVLLVGWDDRTESWILKNSWGNNWGENGYMRIKWGTNRVGTKAFYAVVP